MPRNIYVEGGVELEKALLDVPVKLHKNIMRGALRAGGKIIADEAKRRVPVRSGKLRDSIRVSTNVRNGVISANVRAGDRSKGIFYAHMVEWGTAPHIILAGGHTGFIKALGFVGHIFGAKVQHPGAAPHPFMRPALDTGSEGAIKAVARYISDRLDKLVEK